ncbi:MAG: Hsp33 family molecular chaperone [Hyphomicrobiaceae bacterium]
MTVSEQRASLATDPEATADASDPTDFVLPFQTVASRVSGRIVRLARTVDAVLTRHDYAPSVSEALGQALALTALLGTALKFEGRLTVQTKTDGPLEFLVADFSTPGFVRGYAGADALRVADLQAGGGKVTQGELFGRGHLAMTIDPGGDMQRYQGIVALEGGTLTDAALTYFRQSEQLPTFIRLAVARERLAGGGWSWKAGGLLLQHVAPLGGKGADAMAAAEEQGLVFGEDDDSWRRVEILASTVEDHELVDPNLPPERLLYRLFHEEGVRVSPAQPIGEYCTCSRDRVHGILSRFGAVELADMKEADGTIAVTCEFCSTRYPFRDEDLR